MKRLLLLSFAILALGAAIALAVPLTPGIAPIPDNTVGPGKLTHIGTPDNSAFYRGDGVYTNKLEGPIRQKAAWHSLGGFQLSSTTITIGSSGTWYPITNATDNLWSQTQGDGITITADNIVFANKAIYIGLVTVSVSGTTGDDIFIRAFNVTDNAVAGFAIGATVTGAANFMPIALSLHLSVDANDKIRFEIMNNSAGRNATVRSAVYHVFYHHED